MQKLDIAGKAQVVLLKETTALTNTQIATRVGCSKKQVLRIVIIAKERGYELGTLLKNEYFKDALRSGRPLLVTPQVEEQVIAYIRQLKATRSYNLYQIAKGLRSGLGKESIRKILHKQGFKKVKRTAKSKLTKP
jgi:transposase